MKIYKLGEVCELSKGKTITRATANEGEIPVIGGGLGPTYYNDVANRKPPVITVSASGANAGFVNYWNVPIWASDCTTIVEKSNSPTSIEYIYKYLQSRQKDIDTKLRRGSAQPHVYSSDIADLDIPIPSLEKQREIVEKLDGAFAEIADLEMRIDLLKNLISEMESSTLNSVLANSKRKLRLGDICTVTSSKRVFKSEYVEDGIPFYRTKELKELANRRKIRTELFISRERFSEIKNKYGIPINGDLLISAVGTIGEVLVIDNLGDFYFKDGNIVWLKSISSDFDSNFLAMCLRNITKMLNDTAQGSAYSALTIEKLVEIEIPEISKKEQLEIIKNFSKLSQSIKEFEHNLVKKTELVFELRNSFLRDAFEQEQEVA